VPDLAPIVIWGRPKLGVELVETTVELREHLGGGETEGVLVSKVLSGMPAARAGIEVGDLILRVDGRSVASVEELREALADQTGRTFPVDVVRRDRTMTLDVTIPAAEERPTGPRAGGLPARPPAALLPVTGPPPPPAAPAAPLPAAAIALPARSPEVPPGVAAPPLPPAAPAAPIPAGASAAPSPPRPAAPPTAAPPAAPGTPAPPLPLAAPPAPPAPPPWTQETRIV
jgi:membrane-associated protease RseP (regulator of RpoE activity)